jgi:HEAT repeat protein
VRKTIAILAALLVCAPAWARRPRLQEFIKSFETAKIDDRIRMAPGLGHAQDKKATDALLLAFDIKRNEPKESVAYVNALGLTGDARAVVPLAAAWDYLRYMSLQMGDMPGALHTARWKILEALGRLGGSQAVAILVDAVNDKDSRVAEEAVRGLGRLQVKDAVPALQQFAGGANGNLLQATLEALGDIGDRRAFPTLEQALAKPDKLIEIQANYALSKLGRKESIALLQGFLKNDPGDEKVGLMAGYYLVKLDNNKGLEHLEKMLKKPDSPLAPQAAEALGKSGNPRAVLVLTEASKAPDNAVRLAVTRALGRLGGPRAISTLRKMREDPFLAVQSAAYAALIELGERD